MRGSHDCHMIQQKERLIQLRRERELEEFENDNKVSCHSLPTPSVITPCSREGTPASIRPLTPAELNSTLD